MVQAKSLLERERCFQWYQVSSNLPGKLELLPFCLALHCFEGNNFGNCNFGTTWFSCASHYLAPCAVC